MLWQKTIGKHSFLLIDDKYIDSIWTSWLLEERAFLNHPRERGGGHRFEVSIVGKKPDHSELERPSSHLIWQPRNRSFLACC